jgi:putative ATP-dependent endonuclease of OLD family
MPVGSLVGPGVDLVSTLSAVRLTAQRRWMDMLVRQLRVTRFRGIESMTLCPGRRTVLLGPNNAAKSTLLEALDLVLHSGFGRPRPAPDELDYYARDPTQGFEIEVVLGDLSESFAAEVRDHLEGWDPEERTVIPDPDAPDAEPIVRVRAVGSPDFDLAHEFAKPESAGARFGPRLRRQISWMFDGRTRDPAWQMVFHRGGVLDRLFAASDLTPALEHVRTALRDGAAAFSDDTAVLEVRTQLGADVDALRLGGEPGLPGFELGGVSERELLQTLRIALPAMPEILIPLRRQGRGVQRLLLVASLLRLASSDQQAAPIAAFEEPEEALEPLRQAQIAAMIGDVADRGGQVFVVTHSVDIARSFAVEDIHLVADQPRGTPRSLRDKLSSEAKQAYERRLDGTIVAGLFANLPVLVEGPGDRAVFGVFWDALAKEQTVQPRHAHALDFINCEGAPHQPAMARVLCEAGKRVVAWVEGDVPDQLQRLRSNGHCAAVVTFPSDSARHNLEAALSYDCELDALATGMQLIAETRGYVWSEERADLLSRLEGATTEQREAAKAATDVAGVLDALPELIARALVRSALGGGGATPFEIKGARPARLLAETIVECSGVPEMFRAAMVSLDRWISTIPRPARTELAMG